MQGRCGPGRGWGQVLGRVPWCSHVTQTLAWPHWESLGAWAPGLPPLSGPASTCVLLAGAGGVLGYSAGGELQGSQGPLPGSAVVGVLQLRGCHVTGVVPAVGETC